MSIQRRGVDEIVNAINKKRKTGHAPVIDAYGVTEWHPVAGTVELQPMGKGRYRAIEHRGNDRAKMYEPDSGTLTLDELAARLRIRRDTDP